MVWIDRSGSPLLKELLQKFLALCLTDAGKDRGVMAVVFREEVNHAAAGAAVFLPGTKDNAREAGADDRTGAHGTGFEGDIQAAAVQTPISECGTGIPDGLELGMGGGVRPMTRPSASVITQPTGTSPPAAASWARQSASRISFSLSGVLITHPLSQMKESTRLRRVDILAEIQIPIRQELP